MSVYPMRKTAFEEKAEEETLEKYGTLKVYEVRRHLNSSEFEKLKCGSCSKAITEITLMDGQVLIADEREVDGGVTRCAHLCVPKEEKAN